MFAQLYYRFVLETHNEARKIARFMNRRNVRKNKGEKGGKKTNSPIKLYMVLTGLGRVLLTFAINFVYVFAFMFLPSILLGEIATPEGFGLNESLVYFTLILSCFCGSLIRSGLFSMDDDAYVFLTTIQMEASDYFRGKMITKIISDGAGFLLAFVLVGLNFYDAFYLTLWVMMARVIGDAINLFVFRACGRSISEIPGLPASIMTISVFAAYAFSAIRGHVIDFTGYVYSPLWLFMGLLVTAIVLYGLITYDDYAYVAKRFVNKMKAQAGENKRQKEDELELLAGEGSNDIHFKEYANDESQGIEFLHKIFFIRNREYILNIVLIRCMLLVVATVVGVIVLRLSGESLREIVWQAICECLPLMVFIMFCMSATPGICKAFFYHLDSNILENGQYMSSINIFKSYIVRLRKVCLFDALIGILMCTSLGILGVACGHGGAVHSLIPVYVGVMILSLFFSIFNMTTYYMCQPYTKDMKLRNYTFYAANIGMLLIAYGCVYITVSALIFDIVAGVILAIAISVSSSLVYNLSDKTFKVYNPVNKVGDKG